MAELKEEISKLNINATLLKSTFSDLQESSDKALLVAQKKQTYWNEKQNYKGQCTKKSPHRETERIRQNHCKKGSFYWEKKTVISDKIFSSVNLFLFASLTLFELPKIVIS